MTFITSFSKIIDPRRGQGLRTSLDQVLIMVVLSYLCGHFGYRGVYRFCKINELFFIKELKLLHGIPSHVTFRDVLMRIDDNELKKAFRKWSKTYIPLEEKDWLSTDGKVLSSTSRDTQTSKQNFESVVSLFCHKSGLIHSIAHYERKSKEEGEASLARQLMSDLKDMGLIFTMDAGITQKKR